MDNLAGFQCYLIWEVSPKSWSKAIIPVNDALVIGHRVVEGRLLVAKVWRIARALVIRNLWFVIRKSQFSSPFLPIPADCIPLTAAASGTATTGRQGSLSLCRGAQSPMPQKAKRVKSVRYMMIWNPISVIKTMSLKLLRDWMTVTLRTQSGCSAPSRFDQINTALKWYHVAFEVGRSRRVTHLCLKSR